MKKFAILTIALCFALALGGCGAGPKSAVQTQAPADSGQPQPSDTNAAVQPDPTPTPDDANRAEPSPSGEPTPESTPGEPEKVEKTYYMNQNYFIKPIDENGNKKVVLLTFDDGPKAKDSVEQMLDILDKHSAKAIFFVNGYRVKANPDLLKEIHDRGQTIGNHSWDHIDLKKETEESVRSQVDRVSDIVKEHIGSEPQFFRPPFGTSTDFLKSYVKQKGMLFMTWSNGSLDWADNQHKPDGVIKSVFEQLHPGSDILMHELPWTIEALDKLLTRLEDEGYSFVDPQAIDLEMKVEG